MQFRISSPEQDRSQLQDPGQEHLHPVLRGGPDCHLVIIDIERCIVIQGKTTTKAEIGGVSRVDYPHGSAKFSGQTWDHFLADRTRKFVTDSGK